MKKDLYTPSEIHAILLHGEKPWSLTLQECERMVDTECEKLRVEQIDEVGDPNEITTGQEPDPIEATVDDLEDQLADDPDWDGDVDFEVGDPNELITGDEADSISTSMDDFEDDITESLKVIQRIKEDINQLRTVEEQASYRDFFKAALGKYGVKSPMQLPPDKRREFFKYVSKEWAKSKKVAAKPAVKK
jgi:hypothetical protein